MENFSPYILVGLGIVAFVVVGILILLLVSKNEKISLLAHSFEKLKKSFNDLDEQAKLIVKTDLALNKAQEELDKRLGGLDALQRISRLISTTLDESEIFSRLRQALTMHLAFEKSLILVYDDQRVLNCCVAIGIPDKNIPGIIATLKGHAGISAAIKRGNAFSSFSSPKEQRESVAHACDTEHFVVTPILSQEGMIGMVFVGNQSNAAAITQGDEEIISILASQIGQTLENARLFEQVYRSRQDLEAKIQDRTKQLESALAEVQNISKTKSDFISAVSHELRTPLTSIKGYASILMQGKLGNIPEPVKERLGKINIHSDNLVKLINELLDISRIESGKAEMNLTRCDLSALIDSVHDLLTPQLKDKNIQFTKQVDASIPPMMLDPTQVDRIFINLLGNAVKFTSENGTISVSAKLNNDTVTVDVADTGIGISKNDIGRLFDEFYRVDNQINQNVKGTGLGLPLAKKIVEAHGGKMWVTSIVNQGTTFHFTLPVNQPLKAKTQDDPI